MTDSVRSKLPNCRYQMLQQREIRMKSTKKKVESLNIRLCKFCKKNKTDIIDHKNLGASYLNNRRLHFKKKG